MKPKAKCEVCKWRYPHSLLSPMRVDTNNIGPICGICALEISNQVHGAKREKFTGTMAEHLRQMAITWRENHPDLAPQTPAEKAERSGT